MGNGSARTRVLALMAAVAGIGVGAVGCHALECKGVECDCAMSGIEVDVVDDVTGDPPGCATVTANGAACAEGYPVCVDGGAGPFMYRCEVGAGTYQIQVSAPGYSPGSATVELVDREEGCCNCPPGNTVTIRLIPL
jgi:hypothetical protein